MLGMRIWSDLNACADLWQGDHFVQGMEPPARQQPLADEGSSLLSQDSELLEGPPEPALNGAASIASGALPTLPLYCILVSHQAWLWQLLLTPDQL